jgi:hypothetical protein
LKPAGSRIVKRSAPWPRITLRRRAAAFVCKEDGMGRLLHGMAATLIVGAMTGPAFATPGAPAGPPVTIRIDTSSLVSCYYLLRTFTGETEKPLSGTNVDVSSEASIYKQASTTLQDPAAWKWFENQVVTGPDPAAIRAAMKSLPAAVDTPRNRTGLNMLMDGLDSAYPKFMTGYWPEHLKSLTRAIVTAKKKYLPSEDRITRTLMEKMAFSSIDAPITVYCVVRTGGVSSWGKTAAGYFTVIGTKSLSPEMLLESALHESTHILDEMQPFDTRSVLKQIRQALSGSPPEEVVTFIHGLVAYDAGVLLQRFVNHQYMPAGIHAPSHESEYMPYFSTYDLVWNQYLDGTLDASRVVAKLAEEFKAVRKLEDAKKKK